MAKHSFCRNGVCRYRWAIHVIALWIRRSIHLVHSQLETFLIFTSILTLHMYIITISYVLVAIFCLCTYVYRVGGSSETPQLKLKYYVGDLPLLCVNCFVMIPTHFLIVFWRLHWIFFVFWLRKWWIALGSIPILYTLYLCSFSFLSSTFQHRCEMFNQERSL